MPTERLRAWSLRRTFCVLAFALWVVLLTPGVAFSLPSTSFSFDPAIPDGTPPWYVTAPEVFATVNQTGLLYYSWDGGTVATTTVTTGTPTSLGFAAQGTHTVTVYAVSVQGTETPVKAQTLFTDSFAPGRPTGLDGAVVGSQLSLSWTASTDAGSGVAGYYVYRNDDGVVFDVADRIAFVTSSTSYVDAGTPGGRMRWYAVSARDNASQEGLLTDAVRRGLADRHAGANRILTSLAVSQQSFADGSAPWAVCASAYSFADALVAAPLAGTLSAPVILVGDGPITAATQAELARLGTVDAYVVGGPQALDDTAYDSIASFLPGAVSRVYGINRYHTARVVEAFVRTLNGGAIPERAFLVSGERFPDALSVASAAYVTRCPILFGTATYVPQYTTGALASSGVTQTTIVGGPMAVWSGTETLVPGPDRIAGADRYATSRAFAEWAIGLGILDGTSLVTATGRDFPDGLCSGPYAGELRSPTILTSEADVATLATWIAADPERFDRAVVVGGTVALDDAAWTTFSQAFWVD